MNKKIISIIAAGGLSLMASAAFAQSSASQQQYPQTQNPPPATTSGGMNSGGMSSGSMGSSSTTPPPFSSLDTQGNGYLTQQDAAQNSWLGMHWSQCDANHDGKVTRAEYDACSQQQQ
ncbi:MAG: hypothetical protein ACTHMO_06525 [Rhodanobacteraceae bacterium]